ncbi:MAG TPA: HAD-IA family hydrolase [Candidatus Acidoferrum sp.]|nr:HAD-IA family hydrolase [Candidatus Acidoferrum sp.]
MRLRAIFFDFFGVLYLGGVPNEPLLDFIGHELKPRYKLGIITSTRDVGKYIDRDELQLFNVFIASSEVGFVKPDPEIFRFACQQLHIEPSEAILVDDIPENCSGAQMAGMQAILYTDFPSLQRQLAKLEKADHA